MSLHNHILHTYINFWLYMINIDYRNEHRILQEKLSFSILKNLTLLSLYIKYQHMLLFCSWNLYSTMEWQWFVRVCTVLRKMCTVCSRILAHFHTRAYHIKLAKTSWTFCTCWFSSLHFSLLKTSSREGANYKQWFINIIVCIIDISVCIEEVHVIINNIDRINSAINN